MTLRYNVQRLSIMGMDHDTPDGTCVRDYIHVVDLVDAHIKAFTLLNGVGEVSIFNVAVGKGYSVKEFVNACKIVTGVNITVRHGEKRAGDAAAVYADPTKIKAVLGWEPKYTDLTASLRTAWNWIKVHPKGYDPAPSVENY